MIKRYVGIEVHEADDGDMISYEDYISGLAVALAQGRREGYEWGRRDERTHIKQAVEGIANDDYCYDHDCRMKAKFLSIIDGEES